MKSFLLVKMIIEFEWPKDFHYFLDTKNVHLVSNRRAFQDDLNSGSKGKAVAVIP